MLNIYNIIRTKNQYIKFYKTMNIFNAVNFPSVATISLVSLVYSGKAASQEEQKLDNVEIILDAQRSRSITIVDRATIEAFGDSNATDTLRRQPGVTIQSKPGRPSELRLGGLGGGYVKVLLDGEPAPYGFELESLSSSAIDRIEINRQMSLDSGSAAIAGTINIILRAGYKAAMNSVKTQITSVGGRLGSVFELTLGNRGENGNQAVVIGLAKEPSPTSADAVDSYGSTTSSQKLSYFRSFLVTQESLSLRPSVDFKIDGIGDIKATSTITFRRYETISNESLNLVEGSAKPPVYANNNVDINSYTRSLNGRLDWNRDSNFGGSDAFISVTRQLRRTLGNLQSSPYESDLKNRDIEFDAQVPSTVVSFRVRNKMKMASGSTISFGADASDNSYAEDRFQVETVSPPFLPENSVDKTAIKIKKFGVFIQNEGSLNDKLAYYVGGRVDNLKNAVTYNNEEFFYEKSYVSPLIKLSYAWGNKELSALALSIGQTSKTPTISELNPRRYMSSNNSALSPDESGTPSLKSEVATAIGLSYTQRALGGDVSLGINLKRLSQPIVQELIFENNLWILRPSNLDLAWIRSFDFEYRVKPIDLSSMPVKFDAKVFTSVSQSAVSVDGVQSNFAGVSPFSMNISWNVKSKSQPIDTGGVFSFESGNKSTITGGRTTINPSVKGLELYFSARAAIGSFRVSLGKLLQTSSISRVDIVNQLGTSREWVRTMDSRFIRVGFEAKF